MKTLKSTKRCDALCKQYLKVKSQICKPTFQLKVRMKKIIKIVEDSCNGALLYGSRQEQELLKDQAWVSQKSYTQTSNHT
jgi:benzoyl-CoA reductase/2-hydroxyglutaryl-CoA dehydratase subunit BcrC/BadD/HgdB